MRNFILVIASLVLLSLLACADDSAGDRSGGDGSQLGLGGWGVFQPTSLEERITQADVVVRARLQSVAVGTTREDLVEAREWDPSLDADITVLYMSTLEHTFAVREYLKGTGDSTIVAIVFEDELGKETLAEAAPVGQALLDNRDTQWDNRDAILFLNEDARFLLDYPKGNHYVLGGIISDWPLDNGDYYTIASPHDKRWLPSARTSSGPRGASGSQSFLLDVPSTAGRARGVSAQTANSGTITLSALKSKIASIEQEIVDGGGTDAYRACINAKYSAEAEVANDTARRGSYYSYQYDATVGSGLPAGSLLAIGEYPSRDYVLPEPGDVLQLLDNEAGLFSPASTGDLATTRPLPAGEYRFIENWIPQVYIPCNGQPEEMARAEEVFVTVTAPPGTLHEAFFDPVSSGDAVGYFGTGDALKPTSFSIDDVSTTIQSLKWQDSAVTLRLSPYNALAGHTLDYITGDGTTSLSLDASAATGDSTAGTLIWAVGSQPWSSGDELMLRIHRPQTTPSFSQDSYTFSVPESQGLWEVIATVKATDQDGDAVLHKITSGRDGGRFSIDGWEGWILLMRALDYETKSSYELTVTGTDPGGRSATTTVTINVTDVAE